MRLSRYILILIAPILLLSFVLTACERKPDTSLAVKTLRARGKRLVKQPQTKPCQGSKSGCIPCEYTGDHLCIMSLDWLSSLGDDSSSSQHPPVWIHPNDDVFWVGASGEVSVNVRLDKMDTVSCDDEKKHYGHKTDPVGPFDYDGNLHRIEHAQAKNKDANGLCFKNYIEYKDDPNSPDTLYVDPHIYVGDQ